MTQAYGFGLFPLPSYREAAAGSWRLVRHLGSLADGYATGAGFEPDRHVLYHEKTAWMSTGRMEQESHAVHVHRAEGIVIAAGLGLGLFALAAAAKDRVARVVVVERDADVIALVERGSRLADWPGHDKLCFIVADALDPGLRSHLAAKLGAPRPDYLYVDIWPDCPAPSAPADTATMVRALQPKAAGWWGQELSLGLWCRERGREPDEAAMKAYFADVGVPVPVDPGYAAFCNDVISARLGRPGLRTRSWGTALRRLFRSAD